MTSIFGDTYQGVVSPQVFHRHPYPSRYHGMNLTVPRFHAPFVENPYAVPSFLGVGGSPDGLGGFAASGGVMCFAVGALKGGITGALVGALIGQLAVKNAWKGAAWGGGIGAVVVGGAFGAMCAAAGSAIEQAADQVR